RSPVRTNSHGCSMVRGRACWAKTVASAAPCSPECVSRDCANRAWAWGSPCSRPLHEDTNMTQQIRGAPPPARCDEDSPSTRNLFFRNKLMGAEEFRTEQSYFLERRRLINRTVHGWGVVAGLKIEACGNDGATVGEGLAFDRRGRELLLCKSVALSECNTWLSDKEQPGCFRSLREATPGRYLLCAHYAERPFGDAPDTSHCGCGPVEKNFVRETVVFSVTYLSDCPCPHAESDSPHCAC